MLSIPGTWKHSIQASFFWDLHFPQQAKEGEKCISNRTEVNIDIVQVLFNNLSTHFSNTRGNCTRETPSEVHRYSKYRVQYHRVSPFFRDRQGRRIMWRGSTSPFWFTFDLSLVSFCIEMTVTADQVKGSSTSPPAFVSSTELIAWHNGRFTHDTKKSHESSPLLSLRHSSGTTAGLHRNS